MNLFTVHLFILDQPVPPVQLRAKQTKAETAESENLRYKLENKEEDIKELKKQLRLKVQYLVQIFILKQELWFC